MLRVSTYQRRKSPRKSGRTISLLNVDGKIYFGILAARVMGFVQANSYINETVQKAGVPGIPGCVEHTFAIWDAIQKSKEEKGELSVVWLDLANAYGSVPHKLLKMAMEHFWIPEEIQKLMMKYYDNFMMRFTEETSRQIGSVWRLGLQRDIRYP